MEIVIPKSSMMMTVISFWKLVLWRRELADAFFHLGQHSLPPVNYFSKVETPVQESEGLGPVTQLERGGWGL